MKTLLTVSASLLALATHATPADAASTILFSAIDQVPQPATPMSFTLTAGMSSTTLAFGGYNRSGFDYVTEIELLARDSSTNLVTNDFLLTKAAAGSSAFRIGNASPINGLAFGGFVPGNYDIFSQAIRTVAGQSYTLNFNLRVGTGTPNAFFVSATDLLAGVPEPTTWAAMLLGFALVGATTRPRAVQEAVAA